MSEKETQPISEPPRIALPASTNIIVPEGKLDVVDDSLDKILEGEDATKIIAGLDNASRELFYHLVDELRGSEDHDVLDKLWRVDYIKTPPPISEFIEDPYWLGEVTKPSEDNQGIFPIWRNILTTDFDLDSKVHNVVVTGSLGIGKCHRAGDRVLMFDGTIKPVEHVRPGDRLMGDDSTSRTVLSTSKGHGKIYEVRPSFPKHAPSLFVNGEHILCLQNTHTEKVIEISVKDWVKSSHKLKADYKLYRVPVTWPRRPVPLDPYWLGLWLGDGAWREVAISSKDPEIIEYHRQFVRSFGLKLVDRKPRNGLACESGVVERHESNPVLEILRSMGLANSGESGEKFVPHGYLQNDRQTRLQLLAGLLDTGGFLCCPGCYVITLKHRRLAEGVAQIASTLGYAVGFKPILKTIKQRGFVGDYWRVQISGAHDVPTKLARRLSSARKIRKTGSRTGFKVLEVGEDDYYGFVIDGNHRYLMADCTVTHNTWISIILLLYRITLAKLLRNPQNFFGMSKGAQIYFTVLSVTREQVGTTAFGDAINFMTHSPFFIEECGFDPEMTYSKQLIPLGNSISINGGSKGWHFIGKNVMGILFDEGNFRLESKPNLKAYQLFNEARQRFKSRFQKKSTYLPAVSILSSSAADESSFTETIIKEIMESSDPNQKVYRSSVYRARAHMLEDLDKDRWFRVSYGLRNVEPTILAGWYDSDGKPIGEEAHENAAPGCSVEFVPERFFPEFKRDTRGAVQSISGISVGGTHRLFPSTLDIEICIDNATKDGLVNPCKVDLVPISMEDDRNIWDYLDHNKFLTLHRSQIIPRRHPDMLRFAHIDLATETMAGVSICHLIGQQIVEDQKDGVPFKEYRLIVEYDFVLTIIAGQRKPISIGKIFNFFFWLRDKCGFHFGLVTADQWQCLQKSVRINTDRGLIQICDVEIGDLVQSRVGPRRVTNRKSYPNSPILRVTTDDGDIIEGTPNHKIEAADDVKRAWNFHGGDWSDTTGYEWRRLDQLKVGDLVHMSQDSVTIPDCEDAALTRFEPGPVDTTGLLRRWISPKKMTPEFSEWLGLVYGDGTIGLGPLIDLTVLCGDLNEARTIYRKVFGCCPKPDKNGQVYGLRLSSEVFSQWLKSNGFSKPVCKRKNHINSVEGHIPDKVLRSSRSVKAAFLRGLFSAGGCVSISGQVTFSTSHFTFANDVRILLLTEFGIHSHLLVDKKSKKVNGKLHQGPWYEVQLRGTEAFIDKIGLSFKSKRRKLRLQAGRKFLTRVAKVELLPELETVYDIEVEGDPSYIANGFVSHNSVMPLETLEAAGFKVGNVSLDRSSAPYHEWRRGFNEHRIRCYRQGQMIKEAENLLDFGDKVEKPEGGSKDTTDSAAGAFWNAVSEAPLGGKTTTSAPPSVFSESSFIGQESERPPIELPLDISYPKDGQVHII